MKKYEILEHKADLKIRVFGRNKKELFSNAFFGMNSEMRAVVKKPEEKIKRKINIKSPDLSALLVDFLSEALYLSQVNKEVYNDVSFKKFTDPSVDSGQAEIAGELFGQKIERFGEDIKAVTYHGLDVRRKEDGTWEATVLFDI